jgi:thymidylate synthase
MKLSNWPVLYKDILLKGDLESSTAVCTLWTEREVVEKVIADTSLYSVIGNLYSAQGINAMLRNCIANPRIRTIVLWGAELSLSGHALIQFMKEGIDRDHRIVKARGELEREIPGRAIQAFRKHIEVVDLRGKPATQLTQTLKKIPQKEPFTDKTEIFPPSQPVVKALPSEQVGFRVEGKTVAQTWLKLLNEIYKYGRYKHTRYTQQNELREILNLTAVVTQENPDKLYFPEYLPFGKDELLAYYPEMLSARQIPGTAYNYGHRMMKHFGVNQIQKMKELIRLRPDSKKMIAVTVDPKLDWSRANKGDTPCLTQLLGSIQDKKFIMTAHFRSQDMVHGWPRNAFALRRLQSSIAQESGYRLGQLVLITHSAHIYSDDFKLVENLLMDHYEEELGFTPAVHLAFDARGNVVVEVIKEGEALQWPGFAQRYEKESVPLAVAKGLKEMPKRGKKAGRLIRATLYTPDGGAPLKIFEGRTAQEVAWQLTDWNYMLEPGHMMYIGLELQRAEEAIKQGKRYTQDPA